MPKDKKDNKLDVEDNIDTSSENIQRKLKILAHLHMKS